MLLNLSQLSVEDEVLDCFSYPGTNNIEEENKLRCFNKNMIILKEFHNHPLLKMYLQDKNLVGTIDHQIRDMTSVFYLMSVSPQMEATACKKRLDSSDWCPRLFDILYVLANWGVSLEVLGVQKLEETFYTENLPQNSLQTPNSYNVEIVLQLISSKIATAPMNDREKIRLIVCLVKLLLENQMKKNYERICETIKVLVDCISTWSKNEANVILHKLKITTIDIQNAHHICQYVFFLNASKRCLSIRSLAVRVLLDRVFTEAGFAQLVQVVDEELLDNLPCPELLVTRLDCAQLYVYILLLRSHLHKQTRACPPVSNSTLQRFWVYQSQLQGCVLTDDNLKHLNKVVAALGGTILAERRRLYNVGLVNSGRFNGDIEGEA